MRCDGVLVACFVLLFAVEGLEAASPDQFRACSDTVNPGNLQTSMDTTQYFGGPSLISDPSLSSDILRSPFVCGGATPETDIQVCAASCMFADNACASALGHGVYWDPITYQLTSSEARLMAAIVETTNPTRTDCMCFYVNADVNYVPAGSDGDGLDGNDEYCVLEPLYCDTISCGAGQEHIDDPSTRPCGMDGPRHGCLTSHCCWTPPPPPLPPSPPSPPSPPGPPPTRPCYHTDQDQYVYGRPGGSTTQNAAHYHGENDPCAAYTRKNDCKDKHHCVYTNRVINRRMSAHNQKTYGHQSADFGDDLCAAMHVHDRVKKLYHDTVYDGLHTTWDTIECTEAFYLKDCKDLNQHFEGDGPKCRWTCADGCVANDGAEHLYEKCDDITIHHDHERWNAHGGRNPCIS